MRKINQKLQELRKSNIYPPQYIDLNIGLDLNLLLGGLALSKYIINSGNKIEGTLKLRGAKNAVLPIMAATILNESISILHNVPNISDRPRFEFPGSTGAGPRHNSIPKTT